MTMSIMAVLRAKIIVVPAGLSAVRWLDLNQSAQTPPLVRGQLPVTDGI
jgi:hypothetical protein